MTEIISAKGLATNRNHVLQVRPVFPDGSYGPWGPTFAIIKRSLLAPSPFIPITSSPSGVRLSWNGELDSAFDEQWVLKKFDMESQYIVGDIFDTHGIVVYRGTNSTNIDLDLKQESITSFGVVKVDKYGNRSDYVLIEKLFGLPSPPQNTQIVNINGGFSVQFDKQAPSETNGYHIVKVRYEQPFTTYPVTTKAKTGYVCTLTVSGTPPVLGEIIQVNLSDPQFDGQFKVQNVAGSNVIYTHDVSAPANISVTATSGYLGYIIPTSLGPDQEGQEVYRQETGSGQANFSYFPTIANQRVYVAVGTEDIYKNRVSWDVSDNASQILVYGRNLIADRDTITTGFSYTNNRYEQTDSYWKYGYAGWTGIHDATTKALNTATTGPRLKIEPVTGDTPDSIMLGIANGSATPISFPATIPNVQSRRYPSLAHGLTTANTLNVSKPILDDDYYVPAVDGSNEGSVTQPLANDWIAKYYSSTEANKGLGKIWIECSASDVITDTVNTTLPITLSGIRSLNGSFNIKLDTWGTASDKPDAKLSLYGVTGQWTNSQPGAVIDPHFDPVAADDATLHPRTIIKSNNVTTGSKSAYTCTINMESGSNNYPVVGEVITVSVGNTAFDGTWIVASNPSASSITYVTKTSSTVGSTSFSGSVQTSYSKGWSVSQKARDTNGKVTLTISTPSDGALPQVGELVWVAIGDTSIDNVGDTTVAGYPVYSSTTGSVVLTTPTQGSVINTTAASGRIITRLKANEPVHHLIKSWSISKNEEGGLYNNGSPSDYAANWNWSIPSSVNAEELRLVWCLEFEERVLAFSRAGSTSLVADSSSYTVKLSNFAAWPGSNDYAQTSEENEFNEPQTFGGGATFDGPVTFEDTVDFYGDTVFSGNNTFTGNINASGSAYLNESSLLNADSLLFYTRDYPRSSYTDFTFVNLSDVRTLNSIQCADPVETLGAPAYIVTVSWSGHFVASGSSSYQFILWYRNNTQNNTWSALRSVVGKGPRPSVSIVHQLRLLKADVSHAAFAVTVQGVTAGIEPITGVEGGGNSYETGNRMTMTIFPTTIGTSSTTKPTLASPLSGYNSDNTTNDVDTINIKTATISISSGWTNSYKGDGSTNNYTGGDLMQGYYSSTNGNQRSAWGLGNSNWTKVSGDNITSGNVKEGTVKILSCSMNARATHWWSNSGGTAIIGTHNDGATAAVANFSNIGGKNPDRKRISYPGTTAKTFDLGTTIGAELWNGHVRNNLWGGASDLSASYKIANKQDATGIIFGPGPTTSNRYYGGFAPSSLKITMKVQWKEKNT